MRVGVEGFESFPCVPKAELTGPALVLFGLDDIQVEVLRVEQFEEASAVGYALTIDAFSLHFQIGVGAIDHVQGDLAAAHPDGNINKWFLKAVVHRVLKAILDKGNKEERLNADTCGDAFHGQPDIGLMAGLFDLDIIPDKFGLLTQGNA